MLTNSFRIITEPEKFRITLSYLNGDMKIPNNKNIILFLDSRERKFKTSEYNRWDFSNRVDTVNLRLFPRKVYHVLIAINMKREKFRITLGYLNGDMHIPNNKYIIFLLDSRKRKFKT